MRGASYKGQRPSNDPGALFSHSSQSALLNHFRTQKSEFQEIKYLKRVSQVFNEQVFQAEFMSRSLNRSIIH